MATEGERSEQTQRPAGSDLNWNFFKKLLLFCLDPDTKKSTSELQEEKAILSEIMKTVERRDTLVSVLEEQRLEERAEDRDLESLVLSRGYEFHWAPEDDGWGREKLESDG